jgi:diguanylate cyclase (GGDEF)-like protein/PAS domain S-box-containing protein
MKKSEKISKAKSPDTIKKLKKAESPREAALETLHRSEQRYRTILENIQEGYFEVDLAGNLTFFNDTLCRIIGYSREELMGMNNRQYTDKEESKRVFEAFNKVCTTGEPCKGLAWQITRKDGARRYIEGSISLLKDSSSQPIGFRGIAHDITERKRTEGILQENEERLRGITQNLPGIIFQFYAKDNGEYGVNYFSEPLGEFSEVIDNIDTTNIDALFPTFLSRIHEEDRDRFLKSIMTTVETGTSWNFEGRVATMSGKIIWVQGLSTPTLHENQLVFDGILLNITDRKKAEDDLRKSEESFRNYLEYAPDGVYMSDVKGTFLYGNRKSEEIIGYRREELIGKNFLELNILPEKSLNKAASLLQANMAGNSTGPDEIELIGKEGRLIPVEINTSVVQRTGQGIVLAFVRDITDRKRAEEALRESEHRYQELSIIDDLTQLYNSRHFYVQLEREIERSNRYEQPLTLLMLDLDKFKKFNDTYGHVEGDYVLSRLGQVVKRCLRDPDSAYRYGGEEFTIMLPMTTGEEGIVTAKRIQTELRKENISPVADKNIYMTVSIGMAQYKPMEDMKTFVRRVDKLMYQAKKDGRDRICPES